MKKISNFLFFFLFISLIISSCKKEEDSVLGCTNSNAMNYNSEATSNDGSCLFAYDIAQGVWNLAPNCEEINIPLIGSISLNEQMPETVNVLGGVGNTLYINLSLNSGSSEVSGQIDNEGNITVPSQNITVDVGMGAMDINVSGSGKINSLTLGEIDLTFSGAFQDIFPFSTECFMTLSK